MIIMTKHVQILGRSRPPPHPGIGIALTADSLLQFPCGCLQMPFSVKWDGEYVDGEWHHGSKGYQSNLSDETRTTWFFIHLKSGLSPQTQ